MNDNKLLKIIASFLNSKSGCLFYGINEFRKPKEVFKNTKMEDFRKESMNLLNQKFPTAASCIDLKFIKVNGITVAVFSVGYFVENPVFVKGKTTKKFYSRNDNGLKLMNDIEEIAQYCILRNTKSTSGSTIQCILDSLQ